MSLKSPGPFFTNYLGANAITSNNTFLLASPYTIDNNSWSLLTIPLPSVHNKDFGYDNTLINKTIPSINAIVNSSTTILNVTFVYHIALSTGNITIYKASDNSIRQRVSVTMYEFCKINPDGYTVSITVISNIFNEYGEQYFVTMDNNFVKRVQTNEPLKGIHDGIWILKSDNQKIYSDESIMGSVRLTIDASKRFIKHNNQSAYIDTLLNELADKVPIRRSRLSAKNNFQEVFNGQIAIPIRIEMANNEVERSSSDVFSDLNSMIIYKNITTFSSGVTNDLDQDYGFKLI
ncbi:10522_t:CDS:2, partial [Dentiscutata heterogama]